MKNLMKVHLLLGENLQMHINVKAGNLIILLVDLVFSGILTKEETKEVKYLLEKYGTYFLNCYSSVMQHRIILVPMYEVANNLLAFALVILG